MKSTARSLLIISGILCAALIAFMVPLAVASANTGTDDGKNGSGSDQSNLKVSDSEVQSKLTTQQAELKALKDARRTKLDQSKLKLCETRQAKLVRNMDRRITRFIKRTQALDKSIASTQAYVTKKALTIPNYEALLQDATAKKTTLEARTQALQTTRADFRCDGQTAAGATAAHRAALKEAKAAQKDYRASVKQVLLAVKQARKDARMNGKGVGGQAASKLSLAEVERTKVELDKRGQAGLAPKSVTRWGVEPSLGLVTIGVTGQARTPEVDRFLDGIDARTYRLEFGSPTYQTLPAKP